MKQSPDFGDLSPAYGKMHVYLIEAESGEQLRHLMPPLTKRGELERALLYAKVTKVVAIDIFGNMAFITVRCSEKWWLKARERAAKPPEPRWF